MHLTSPAHPANMVESTAAYEVLPFDRWRAVTARFIQENAQVDTVFFTALVDASALDALRRAQPAQGKPSYTALVVKAISVALTRHPQMNRLVLPRWPFRFRAVQLHEVHAVVAVERRRKEEDTVYAGLIRNSDRKSAVEISRELHDLSQRDEVDDPRMKLFMRLVRHWPSALARWVAGLPTWGPRLWIEHRGGSFALTTVGKYGVDSVCVKWPWPLSFTYGEVKQRPLVVDGAVTARSSFYVTMGWRRDLCNGAPAARFFKEIVDILERADLGMEPAKPPICVPAQDHAGLVPDPHASLAAVAV